MSEELGTDTEAGEATKCPKPKCTIILLEAFRMRDMQVNVSLHIQDSEIDIQDH